MIPSSFPRSGPCEWCGLDAAYLRGPHQSPDIDGPEGRLLRCGTCYRYLHRTGAERPVETIRRQLDRDA